VKRLQAVLLAFGLAALLVSPASAQSGVFGQVTNPIPTPANTAVPTATAVNTPVNTPTPAPTCAAGVGLGGTGTQGGIQCQTPVAPTAFPTLAVGQAIVGTGGQGVQAGNYTDTTATPVANSYHLCPGGAAAVCTWATPVSAPPTTGIIGTTFATSDTTMTNGGTYYDAVILGSALVNGGVYLLGGSVLFQEINVTADYFNLQLLDSTNSVTIWSGMAQSGASLANDEYTITVPMVKYSGFAGTPTIKIRGLSSAAGNKIKATDLIGNANVATSVTAFRVS
jgi:hypothetical protein